MWFPPWSMRLLSGTDLSGTNQIGTVQIASSVIPLGAYSIYRGSCAAPRVCISCVKSCPVATGSNHPRRRGGRTGDAGRNEIRLLDEEESSRWARLMFTEVPSTSSENREVLDPKRRSAKARRLQQARKISNCTGATEHGARGSN